MITVRKLSVAAALAAMLLFGCGVRGTSMPAFAESSGGMLGDKQIDVVRVVGSFADSGAEDFARPGHVFPLRCRAGGVLERRGHTEAAVDLSRLAGLHPSGVICEILKDDGTMARVPDLVQFCRVHQLKMITIEDLVSYRFETDNDTLKDADLTSKLRFHHSSLST